MENLSMIKLNRRRKAMQLALTIGLALLFVVALLWGLQGATPALADPGTLHVDGASGQDTPTCGTNILPCQTISYTLNTRALESDTILVTAGTYTENLTITGITVTLRGGHTISGTLWITGTSETIVDGDEADRVFVISNTNSVLENLTITGGYAPSGSCWGSGVWVTNGDVTIRSCTITDNGRDCGSGGIEVNDVYGPAHLTLESSTVSNNIGGLNFPAGMHVFGEYTSAEVRGTTFYSNTTVDTGGGIGVTYSSTATIEDTHLISNTAGTAGGGIFVNDSAQAHITDVVIENNNAADGGGIAVREGASAFISGTQVINNEASNRGGGVGIDGVGPVVVMTNTVINDNDGLNAGGVWGTGITFTGTNLLIADNDSYDGSAGINLESSNVGQLMNVTVSGNDSTIGFDGAKFGPAGFSIINSIFWGNGTTGANLSGNNLNVTFSDVGFPGGWTGTGNINADPLFIGSGDYHLGVGSPCIDKGTVVGAPVIDLDGAPRDAVPDMGAYEFQFYDLTVSLAGTGSGSVSSLPEGIDCGTDCTENYADGTSVTLTANTDTGSSFAGWSGACTNTSGDCVVNMTAAQAVTGTFTLNEYELSVFLSGRGSGSVTSVPTGIHCTTTGGTGENCTGIYDYGTVVTLTATADTLSNFAGWSGACLNAIGDCVVTMGADETVTARFSLDQYELSVTLAGEGSGSVSSEPIGITCTADVGSDCTEPFDYGTVVTLTATADTLSIFAGWSGACSGTDDCAVTMDVTKIVRVTFDLSLPTGPFVNFLPLIQK